MARYILTQTGDLIPDGSADLAPNAAGVVVGKPPHMERVQVWVKPDTRSDRFLKAMGSGETLGGIKRER